MSPKTLLLPLAMISALASAEDVNLPDIVKAATVDMPVTTAPASFLLGSSGESVPRLSSFRAVSAQAGRAFDAKGNVANAVAVELAPGLALGNLTFEEIKTNTAKRIWARTTVSFASKVKTEKQGAQSAVGLQSILYAPAMEEAALMAASAACMTAQNAVNNNPVKDEPGTKWTLPDDVKEKIQSCQTGIDAILTKWNQTVVAVGGGRTFSASSADMPASKNSSAVWLSAAYGGDVGSKQESSETRMGYLLTAHFRRSTNVMTANVTGTEVAARQQLFGLNFRYGNARLAGIGEYSITSSKASGTDFRDRKRGLLGLEYKVDKDMYLTVGMARDTGLDADKQSVLAKLNWGFSKTPVLSGP